MGSDSRPEATAAVLVLRGDLDGALKDVIATAFAPLEHSDIAILSFAQVTFCDSTILSAIVRLQKRRNAGGKVGEIKFVGLRGAVRRVFELCNFDRIFTICDTMEQATESHSASVKIIYTGEVDGDTTTKALQASLGATEA